MFETVLTIDIQPGTGRAGVLSLRSQRLSMPMRETLRKDLYDVDVSFMARNSESLDETGSESEEPIVRHVGDTWRVKPYEIVYLATAVRNMTGTSEAA